MLTENLRASGDVDQQYRQDLQSLWHGEPKNPLAGPKFDQEIGQPGCDWRTARATLALVNNITSLKGIECLKVCHTVYMGNNKVSEEKEFDKLCELPCLEELVFFGNPIHRNIHDKEGELAWPQFVKSKLPDLRKLDGISMVEWNMRMNAGNKDELREVFDKIDTDQSGSLDMKEMKAALQDEEIQTFLKLTASKVEKAFQDIDADCSGDITWEEFEKYFTV